MARHVNRETWRSLARLSLEGAVGWGAIAIRVSTGEIGNAYGDAARDGEQLPVREAGAAWPRLLLAAGIGTLLAVAFVQFGRLGRTDSQRAVRIFLGWAHV